MKPRVSTAAALYCFRCGEFWSLGECWKQLCENNFYIAAQPRGVVCKPHLWYNIVVLKPQQSRKIVVCRPHSRKENI